MMIGLDPGGVPKSKGALLFALYLANSFTAVSNEGVRKRNVVTDQYFSGFYAPPRLECI